MNGPQCALKEGGHCWAPHSLEVLLESIFYAIQMVAVNIDVTDKAGDYQGEYRFALLVLAVLLPLSAALGLIKAFFYERLRPSLFRWVSCRVRDHVVIVGAGHTGRSLLEHYLGDTGERVVCVVEQAGYTDYYHDLFRAAKDRELLWIGSDARRNSTFGASSIGHPRRIYLTAGCGQTNLNLLDALFAARRDDIPDAGRIEVLVKLTSHVQREVLESAMADLRARDPEFAERFWVRAFSVEALAARNAFQSYWPLSCSGIKPANLLLVGDSAFGLELVDQIARLAHFDERHKTHLRWVVPSGSTAPVLARARNGGLREMGASPGQKSLHDSIHPVVTLDVMDQMPELFSDPLIRRNALLFEGARNAELACPQVIFVCTNSREMNIWIAHELATELTRLATDRQGRYVGATDCRIVAAIDQVEDLELAQETSGASIMARNFMVAQGSAAAVEIFEILPAAVNAISNDVSADIAAMLVKRAFDLAYSDKPEERAMSDLYEMRLIDPLRDQCLSRHFQMTESTTSGLDDLLSPYWSRCSDEERWANRDNVDHILLKIAYVAERSKMKPEEGDASYEDLLALMQVLQGGRFPLGSERRKSTQRWSAGEFDALMNQLQHMLHFYSDRPLGWVLQQVEHRRWAAFKLARGWQLGPRDNAAKLNPDLLGFDELGQHEQGKDELFVRMIPAVLRVLWMRFPDWQK